MFKKLISNLPFSPQVLDQVVFYGRRLAKENATRKLTLVFTILAFSMQIVIFASPPESSVAASSNDIIYGGISGGDPRANLLARYDQNTDSAGHRDIQAIFSHFQISRSDLNNVQETTLNSSDRTLYSLGRNPHSNLDQVIIISSQRYYLRPLWTWGENKTYKALAGIRNSVMGGPEERFFAVLESCGNIVIKLRDQPDLKILKATQNNTAAPNTYVKPGDNLSYRIFFNNVGPGTANLVALTDVIPEYTRYVSHGSGAANKHEYISRDEPPIWGQPAAKHVSWLWNKMPGHAQNYYVDLNVKVINDAPDGARICNTAVIRSAEIRPTSSNRICHTVKRTVTTPEPPEKPPTEKPDNKNPNIDLNKQVSNLTTGLQDANDSTAQAGDILEYRLITINSGNGRASGYTVKENIQDILEYADVISTNNGTLKDGMLTWPAENISAESSMVKTFKVKVKNPIPTTPRSSSSSDSFDLKMTNEYGNIITVNLTTPTIKLAEHVVTQLPNTGISLNTILFTGFLSLTSFFFLRNRQLIKELKIIRNQHGGSYG